MKLKTMLAVFDEISRIVADPMPRRRAFRLAIGTVVGSTVAAALPRRLTAPGNLECENRGLAYGCKPNTTGGTCCGNCSDGHVWATSSVFAHVARPATLCAFRHQSAAASSAAVKKRVCAELKSMVFVAARQTRTAAKGRYTAAQIRSFRYVANTLVMARTAVALATSLNVVVPALATTDVALKAKYVAVLTWAMSDAAI